MTTAIERLEAQGELQPGDEGYWKVWGARAGHARAGDIILSKTADGGDATDEVVEVLSADVVRPKFRGVDGKTFSIGAMTPIILMRPGTHNTLA